MPQFITTPLPEFVKPTILGTPDDRDRLAGLFDLPGYKPTGIGHDTLQESFPIHDHDWKDSVLLKDYEVGDYIELEEYSHRVQLSGQTAKYVNTKNKEYIQKDRAYNSGSGPHDGEFKLYNKQNKKIATVNKDGKILRVHK